MHRLRKAFENNEIYIRNIAVIYAVVFIFIILITTSSRTIEMENQNYISIMTADKIILDNSKTIKNVKLPYDIEDALTKTVYVDISVPKNPYKIAALSFIASQSNVTIYNNEKSIYSHTYLTKQNVKNSGSGRVFCPLFNIKQGDKIRIKLDKINDAEFNSVDKIYLQSAVMTEHDYIPRNKLIFGITMGLFMSGVLLLIAAIVYTSFGASIKSLIYLSSFIISSSGWALSSSKMMQIFTSNWELMYAVEYMCLYAIPVSLWGFLDSNWKRRHKIGKIGFVISYIFFAGALTLKAFGIYDFYQSVIIFQWSSILSGGILSYIILKKVYGNSKSLKLFYFSALTVIIVGVYEIFLFYKFPTYDSLENKIIYALAFMIIVMLANYVSSSRSFLEKLLEDKVYRELAYKDALTGLGNRTKFERDILELETKIKFKKLIFIVADVNYLKNINDTMGHVVGDLAIKTIGESIKTVFEKIGGIYRVGGDEFCIIVQDKDSEYVKIKLEELDEILLCTELGFPISISYGFEEHDFKKHDSLMKLYKSADDRMYETKSFYRKMADI